VYQIGRILNVRRVASSCRTVKTRMAVILFLHFSEKAQAAGSDAKEKSQFAGMAKKFESPVFIKNLA